MKVRASVPLWLHLLATCIAGAAWLWIAYENATNPELQARPLDPEFAKTATTALGATLLPRFAVAQYAEPAEPVAPEARHAKLTRPPAIPGVNE